MDEKQARRDFLNSVSKPSQKRHRQRLKDWHGYVGLGSVIFVMLVSITGLFLIHTDDLHLSDKFVESDLLLSLYEIPTNLPTMSYDVAPHGYIVGVNHKIYLNDQWVAELDSGISGAAVVENVIVVTTTNEVLQITCDGVVVERTYADPPIEMLGILNDVPIFKSLLGEVTTFISNPHAIDDLNQVNWTVPVNPPNELIAEIIRRERHQMITAEKLILDLHSGRLFGNVGKLLFDAIAIALCVLAITGFSQWVRAKNR